jgi:hypothetical protein
MLQVSQLQSLILYLDGFKDVYDLARKEAGGFEVRRYKLQAFNTHF